MNKFESKYKPGDKVLIADGDITATIESMKWTRGRSEPVIEVEWFADGCVRVAWVYTEDIEFIG